MVGGDFSVQVALLRSKGGIAHQVHVTHFHRPLCPLFLFHQYEVYPLLGFPRREAQPYPQSPCGEQAEREKSRAGKGRAGTSGFFGSVGVIRIGVESQPRVDE